MKWYASPPGSGVNDGSLPTAWDQEWMYFVNLTMEQVAAFWAMECVHRPFGWSGFESDGKTTYTVFDKRLQGMKIIETYSVRDQARARALFLNAGVSAE